MLISRLRSLVCLIVGHRPIGLHWSEAWQSYLQTCARCGRVDEFTPRYFDKSLRVSFKPDVRTFLNGREIPAWVNGKLVQPRGTADTARAALPDIHVAYTPQLALLSEWVIGEDGRSSLRLKAGVSLSPSSTATADPTPTSSTSTATPSHDWHPSIAASSESR